MAVGTVITVLSNIPWGQVVDAAPKIAEGASRLWEAAKKFRKPKPVPETSSSSTSAQPTEAERLQGRLSALEEAIQELREQMQASAGVIKDLANQNALLIQRMEVARLRLVRIAIGGLVCIVALSLAIFHLWTTR